jgi:tRNA 2-thiouridine synthesizing protein E
MGTFTVGDKTYSVDRLEYLLDFNDWDENFARGMAPKVHIKSGLSEDHWKIINFIRDFFKRTGKCPTVYETCQMNRLDLGGLKKLFPEGYLRGACKLAGVTYMEGYFAPARSERATTADREEKTFEVNMQGFLINPQDWDKWYAINKALELKMPRLTEKHWHVINFLRDSFEKKQIVPNIYDTCEATRIGLEELQLLFPDGYQRGAVKIAGLRAR